MKFRTLADEELTRLRQQEEYPKPSSHARRLNPLQRLDLREAVKDRKKTVTMQGVKFTLRYEGGKIFYKPVTGFVPCGWIETARVLSPEYML